jgi:Protein of unknown function (DUF3110)
MEEKEKIEGWVYVVVCDPGKNEQFFGLYNKEKDIDFIPAFPSKDAANDCFLTLPKEKGRKYEIQAIHIEELHRDAEKNGFVVAMVDNDGNIIKGNSPE